MLFAQADLLTALGQQVYSFLAIVVLLGFSAFFSGSETVLFSLSGYQRLQLQGLHRIGALIGRMLDRPEELLLAILFANMTVNVAIFTVSSTAMYRLYAQDHAEAATAVGLATLAAVVTFGEILPKAICFYLRTALAPVVALPIYALMRVLLPALWTLRVFLVKPLTRLLIGAPHVDKKSVNRGELQELLQTGLQENLLDRPQQQMLSHVLELKDLRVSQVMVPRVDIKAVEINDPPEKVRAFMRETHLARVPVYRKSIDDIIGVVHARRVFIETDKPLTELTEPVQYVPEQQAVDQLLSHFRKTNTKFAIAVDEYGGVAGLVTLEDVLEQIVGDIVGPQDDPSTMEIHWLDDRTCEVSGLMPIKEFVTRLDLPQPDVAVNTVSGLVMSKLGRLPAVSDQVRFGSARLEVSEVQRRRAVKIKVHLADHQGDP